MKESPKYDVFISYRREGADETARVYYERLTQDGYRVAFDLESMRSGDFPPQLFGIIRSCKDFILVLSPNALERCSREDDWVRRETACAIESGKNIVPVALRGFTFPPKDSLPEDIRQICEKQGVVASAEHFDSTIKKLESYLESRPVRRLFRHVMWSLINVVVLAGLVCAAYVGYRRHPAKTPIVAEEVRNKSEKHSNEPVPGSRNVISIGNDGRVCDFPLRWCPKGTFLMGSPTNEFGRAEDETQHKVTFTSGFWMGETEVTQKQWEFVMGNNPSTMPHRNAGGSVADCPVNNVSWNDCVLFVRRLNSMGVVRKSRLRFRLPTESEWEYACRAGTTGPYSGTGRLADMGWCVGSNVERLQAIDEDSSTDCVFPVARKQPNVWGIYDMHGNVFEWCSDWYAPYSDEPLVDPKGPIRAQVQKVVKIADVKEPLPEPGSGKKALAEWWDRNAVEVRWRVVRGGCYGGADTTLRSASRSQSDPAEGYKFRGLRICADDVAKGIDLSAWSRAKKINLGVQIMTACLKDMRLLEREVSPEESDEISAINALPSIEQFKETLSDGGDPSHLVYQEYIRPLREAAKRLTGTHDWRAMLSEAKVVDAILLGVSIAVAESVAHGCYDLDDVLSEVLELIESTQIKIEGYGIFGQLFEQLKKMSNKKGEKEN